LRELEYYLQLTYEKAKQQADSGELLADLAYRIGDICYWRGKLTQAETFLTQYMSTLEKMNQIEAKMLHACGFLARIYANSAEFDRAKYYLNKGYQISLVLEQSGAHSLLSRVQRYQAEVEIKAGNYDTAAKLLENTVRLIEKDKLEESSSLARNFAILGQVEILRSNYEAAQTVLEGATELANRYELKYDLALASQNFALLKIATNNLDEALSYANKALSLYKQLGMELRIAETEEIIARCKPFK